VIDRIARFLSDPSSGAFDELALAAFAYQYERVEPYRRLCDSRGTTPANVTGWRQVPPVPTSAFKRLRLAAAPEQVIFRSSGTTAGEVRSTHYQPYPDLYRQAIDASFPHFCLPAGRGAAAPGGGPVPMLSLVPPLGQLPDSSLSFMIDHVMARFASAEESAVAFGKRGVEAVPARSWTAARQRRGTPALVLATSLALDQWLGALERLDLRFRLPAGSAVFETGGFKGHAGEVSPQRQLERLEERLGLPPGAVVREYGMTELTSQCYTRALLGGDPDLFVAPHWVRVRILDPQTLEDAAPGAPGLIAVFDLANLGSAAYVLTEDLGIGEPAAATDVAAFRLAGRAAGAELRGCSLVAEELHRSSGA
jgi:Acyl-protein synthetase, LuxE